MEIEKLARELAQERIATLDVNGIPVAVIPEGYQVHDLERFCDGPVRIKRKLTTAFSDSFVRYVSIFQKTDTRMYGSLSGKLSAVIDDHDASGDAAWNDHIIDLVLRHSDEFRIWSALANNAPCSQTAFLDVLRDRRGDVVSMQGADLLSLIQNFRATKNASFRSMRNIDNGDVAFEYSQETRGAGTLQVPEEIKLMIPIFEGEPPEDVVLRLRFEIEEGVLKFFITIAQRELLVKNAVKAAFDRVEKSLSTVPMFFRE